MELGFLAEFGSLKPVVFLVTANSSPTAPHSKPLASYRLQSQPFFQTLTLGCHIPGANHPKFPLWVVHALLHTSTLSYNPSNSVVEKRIVPRPSLPQRGLGMRQRRVSSCYMYRTRMGYTCTVIPPVDHYALRRLLWHGVRGLDFYLDVIRGPPPQSMEAINDRMADPKVLTCRRMGSRRDGRRLPAGCTSREDRLSLGNERALRCGTPEGARGRSHTPALYQSLMKMFHRVLKVSALQG